MGKLLLALKLNFLTITLNIHEFTYIICDDFGVCLPPVGLGKEIGEPFERSVTLKGRQYDLWGFGFRFERGIVFGFLNIS